MAKIVSKPSRRRVSGGVSDENAAKISDGLPDVCEAVKKSGLRHIAFIMDGNGRWATARGMKREFGHKQGAETFENIVQYCGDIGIGTVTVYAFSTENWNRPKAEVDAIMELFSKYLDKALRTMEEKRIHYTFIGDRTPFTGKVLEKMEEIERISEVYRPERSLNIAINYGGRDELKRAVNRFIAEHPGEEITEDEISARMDTVDSPPPDLIVRTAGERRLSNFLLWQSAYAEYYFTPTLWPDMTGEDVDAAVFDFSSRGRRYGGTVNK